MSQLMKKMKITALLLGMAAIYTHNASAATCSFAAGNSRFVAVVPLQAQNITVGPDTPNGTVLLSHYVGGVSGGAANTPTFSCTSEPVGYNIAAKYANTSTPKALSAWSGSPYPGQVYETGVPGIGVVTSYWGRSIPTDRTTINVGSNAPYTGFVGAEFDLILIKIGPVSPGTIRGADLPSVAVQVTPQGGVPLSLNGISFSGTINIVSQTCQTPDVHVPMGTVNIAQNFKGLNSASAWRDASIRLTNCPRFYGTKFQVRSYTSVGTPSSIPTANSLELKLAPNTSIIDSAKGILGIKTGTESATGVGIQMAYGNIGDASPALVNFANSRSFNMVNNDSTTQTLPLVARYIQTSDQVTPGKADAAVTFMINYY
ncbi:fimbrial protein [Serratia sp. D1N4]